ncbi:ABC transporter ATP-binding protein [Xylocopilactobacillus apis]|uniref:Antibiotic ABC transporter ATP-binding protein n=1 Tax=Xylocopilactobacillus apis TaxID=2932183 RepID=A0AAU9DFT9_9LACO|nr:ABC transporter ATP-binding protein [Xylocopilactobacillus apis]BDR57121.1 antibiotic ABC transporter ATP-binding protein [Xylocopilactobacillus apis]
MILELKDLTKSFKKQLVLDGINLSIEEPRLIALVAPNGSGKTTLLNIICNLERPDTGSVKIEGVTNHMQEIFYDVTYMQDNSVLYTELTGMDHIKFVQAAHNLSDERVEEVLTDLKMNYYMNKKVQNYSLGMKQHLLFAMVILPKPKLLLMDEPLNGLDPASVARVRETLKDLFKAGTTILFSSHNLDQIDKLTDDIYFLKNKQLVSCKEIIDQSINTYTVVVNDIEEFADKIKQPIEIETAHKGKIKCSSEEMAEIIRLTGSDVLDYEKELPPLEQLYFDLFEDYRDGYNYV